MANFYVVKNLYRGPNTAENLDADVIKILTKLPDVLRGDAYGEFWLNDDLLVGMGVFEKLEDARESLGDEVRWHEGGLPVLDQLQFDEDLVDACKLGKLGLIGTWEAQDWIRLDVAANTSDEEIEELAVKYEEQVNSAGQTFGPDNDLVEQMQEHRQNLVDQTKTEAA